MDPGPAEMIAKEQRNGSRGGCVCNHASQPHPNDNIIGLLAVDYVMKVCKPLTEILAQTGRRGINDHFFRKTNG